MTTGRDVRIGDTVALPTGRVVVDALYAEHGGIEAVVHSADRKATSDATRILWWWPQQAVRVVARSSESGAQGWTIGPRPVRGAAGRKKTQEAA